MSKILVTDFVSRAPTVMDLRVLAGASSLADKEIISPRIQKLGLALAGFARLYSFQVEFKLSDKAKFLISYSFIYEQQ